MRILAVSGSLRRQSKNTMLVQAATHLTPEGVEIAVYEGLGDLPVFNQDLDDLDNGKAPAPVLAFRAQLQQSDGVFISTPEYAHGVAGGMKNALDWLVGSGELMEMPMVLFNASPTSLVAHAAMLETLQVVGAHVIEAALPRQLGSSDAHVEKIRTDPELSESLRDALSRLVTAIEKRAAEAECPCV